MQRSPSKARAAACRGDSGAARASPPALRTAVASTRSPGASAASSPPENPQLRLERNQDQDLPRIRPVAVRRGLARLGLPLAALPDLLRFARRVFAGEGDVSDLRQRNARAARGGLVEQIEVRGATVVDEPHQLGAVTAPQGDVPAVVERPVHQLRDPRLGHRRPVTRLATVSAMARGDSNAARTALGSKPQCTMQSWQRGLPLLRPYFDQSVSSISSRKVLAYPSWRR